jgi:acyl carrier protein
MMWSGPDKETVDWLANALELDVAVLHPSTDFERDLRFDDAAYLHLVMVIEDRIGRRLPEDFVRYGLTTVADAVYQLQSRATLGGVGQGAN